MSHNSERYIHETIQSVILQRGDFFIEYIVIDNCSSDGTLKILEDYRRQFEIGGFPCNCLGVNFGFLSEPDNGMYDALAKGMRMCRGDYIAYINSDDFYLPNAFSTVASVFENSDVNWLTGVPGFYNGKGAITTLDIPCVYASKYMRSGVYGKYLPYLQQESTFWRIELCDELDLSMLGKYRYAGDYYLWYKFAKKNRLYTVNAQLSGFRLHSDNKSSDTKAYCMEFNSIADNKLALYDYPVILVYKVLYKLFGNNLLKIIPGVINLH